VGVIQPGGSKSFEQFVGAFGVHGVFSADGGVAERGGEKSLSDSEPDP